MQQQAVLRLRRVAAEIRWMEPPWAAAEAPSDPPDHLARPALIEAA